MPASERSTSLPQTGKTPNRGTGPRMPQVSRRGVVAQIIQRISEHPETLTPADILSLQKTIGNQAVQRLLRQHTSASSRELDRPPSQRGTEPPIQRQIVRGDLENALDMVHSPQQIVDGYATNEQKRNREETTMLYEELSGRYDDFWGQLGNQADAFLTDVIQRVNNNDPITAVDIRQAVTSAENHFNLNNTTPQPPAPATDVDRFIQLLAARRGSYHWAGGTSQAFKDWITGPIPLLYPLASNAAINCWEAVLVSAAEAGLVTVGQLRGAYLQQDIANGVFTLITRQGVTVVNHPADGANNMQIGDIVMIEGESGNMHHVVTVVAVNQHDYAAAQVMSLWNSIGGGGFTKAPLGNVLPPQGTFRYATL